VASLTQEQQALVLRGRPMARRLAWRMHLMVSRRVRIDDLDSEALLALTMATLAYREEKATHPEANKWLHYLWYIKRYISGKLWNFVAKEVCSGTRRGLRNGQRMQPAVSLEWLQDEGGWDPQCEQPAFGYEPALIAARHGCTELEVRVIGKYYDGTDRSLADIGREIGVCRERTRQLVNSGYARIRAGLEG
jgi:hypothetical protein